MNTVVIWVMMAWTGHTYAPTLEFKSEALCNKAGYDMKVGFDARNEWGRLHKPWCVRIEK
jgi:hypothetical protein